MDQEKVIVIDFGGQYNQLVARRVRECNVYCEIYSYKTDLAQIKAMNPKGIILTGGPNSCYEDGAPTCTKELFELGVPVLGLCYGAQLMQHVLGGKVEKAPVREYGKTETFVDKSSALFSDVSECTRIQDCCPHSRLPSCSSRVYREESLCNPVPPRGSSYSGRNQDASQLCSWSMRMCRNMEDGCIC